MQRRFLLQPDRESGYTPFHRAIVEGNLAAMLLFLRHAMDTSSSERLIQRPMTALHTADANNNHVSNISSKNNTLLLAMASATDHEGMTPLRLLGKLQQSALSKCRKDLQSFRPQVDPNALTRLRSRRRRSSFDDEENSDTVMGWNTPKNQKSQNPKIKKDGFRVFLQKCPSPTVNSPTVQLLL